MAGEVYDNWPAGATWVFQGTVQEDGTGGTHVSSLTVTPGIGNEMQFLYGMITSGATATAQLGFALIDDGTNILTEYLAGATLGQSTTWPIPSASGAIPTAGAPATPALNLVSGTMRLVIKVSTAAISVTQTFAVVCRIKGAVPTAVLADSVGTPVLTTNTNKVF